MKEWVHGYADLPNERPNRMDTRFGTASAGKAFVAVGVLQLVEKGVIALDSTIGELLPMDWKAIDPQITVRQLLTHTSGIPDYFDESVMDEYEELWVDFPNYRVRRNRDLLPLFIDKPMMYPKGERFQYNNTGFVVLAMIIEQATGMVFDEYLKENVFLPAGMGDTGYFELDRLPRNCANAYIWDEARGGIPHEYLLHRRQGHRRGRRIYHRGGCAEILGCPAGRPAAVGRYAARNAYGTRTGRRRHVRLRHLDAAGRRAV